MFKDNEETRSILNEQGYTARPSIDQRTHKIASYLSTTIEAWNNENPNMAIESDEDVIQFNSALRINSISRNP
jgi:hypothetical protein